MKRHDHIIAKLYDYVRGELPDAERAEVERHCSGCDACSEFVERIRTIMAQLPGTGHQPSDFRSPEYWNEFAGRVEDRIARLESRKTVSAGWYDSLLTLLNVHWKPLVAVSASVSIVLLAVTLWLTRPAVHDAAPPVASADTLKPVLHGTTASYNPEVGDYLRRSKMLFIGVTNMKLDDARNVDLSTEQELSRRLLHEARDLRQKPLDIRSAQIIENVQKILIDLSNMKEGDNIPGVEIIRAGIHNENLLFKIRIAEAQYDSVASLPGSDNRKPR
jgi:hypothetical protein